MCCVYGCLGGLVCGGYFMVVCIVLCWWKLLVVGLMCCLCLIGSRLSWLCLWLCRLCG